MNETRSGNIQDFEKPFPGCLARTVNLFDLSTSVTGNKLLCDRPHRDGSFLLRSQSEFSRMVSPQEDQMVNKMIMSNGKASGTPMKMLIDQEMSKEMESKHNSPNVVAKLMGLDTLPLNPVSTPNKYNLRGHYLAHDSVIPLGCWRQEIGILEKDALAQMHQFPRQEEYKDVNEIWKQSLKTNCRKEKSPQKEIYKDSIDEKKMALVSQKFMEAKRLATNEKLRQSKEFQDAIEVLNSNRDLFVKFLQEPTLLFSENLCEFQSFPPSPETKCITVLRPSNTVNKHFDQAGNKAENQMQKSSKVGQPAFWDKNKMRYSPTSVDRMSEHVHPTRIVVLKPNHEKTHDVRTVASTPCFIPVSHGSLDEGPEDDDVRKARVATRENTHQLRVNLMRHRRDGISLSSIYSDGYTGDESFENEFAVGILSDSEVLSPSPRLSWECMNKFCSPHSSPSFSQSSSSPEYSVCREAKKRLSERWALMASNGNSQEQRHLGRSPSTLGEMLALSETKKSIGSDHKTKNNKELEPGKLTSTNDSNIGAGDSPKFLNRSKSLPASSLQIGKTRNVEVLGPETGKTDDLKELTKLKSMKSSLKGKLSNFFSYRNKKSNKEKRNTSIVKDNFDPIAAKTPGTSVDCLERIGADAYCSKSSGLEACSSATLRGSTDSTLNLTTMELMSGVISSEAGLSFTKPGNVLENQEQPSPISVLEPPIEEDDITINESSVFVKSANQGVLLPMKSNLIDKSPPIESISQTLNWDSLCSSPYSFKTLSSYEGNEEEQQLQALVHTVLSAAGLDGKLPRDSIFPRWHSLEYPIDPSLREKYANGHEKEPLHEAKRRQLRSSRKLVFDCVNEALVDITIFDSQTNESLSLLDCIWSRMKEWFSEAHVDPDDDGNGDSSVVEKVVIKVVGKGWVEEWRAESDNLIEEIEQKLLVTFVEEAATDLIGIIR